jgi:pyridoxal phosphate enzyme (YggS family)
VPTTSSPIEERFQEIQGQIRRACERSGRDPGSVQLLAVSKRQAPAKLRQVIALDHHHFGENQVQAWQERVSDFTDTPAIRWHLIGPLQTNKVKFLVQTPPALLHTIDRIRLVDAIEKKWPHPNPLDVLVQVNIDEEPQKAGCSPEATLALAQAVAQSTHLRLRGLMCIPRHGAEAPPRAAFARLRDLGRDIAHLCPQPTELSMGMSQDFEVAIEEGSTLIRVGSALFGPR